MRHRSALVIVAAGLLAGCFGDPSPHPYRPPAELRAEAQALSEDLEAFVRAWLRGENDGQIPTGLLPDGYEPGDNKDFRLVDPDSVEPAEVWAVREAAPVDRGALYHSLPDPNCTYLFLGTPYAPFGSKLVIEGEFPRCRFFNIQVSPPFDGVTYYYNRELGAGEVGWVDADIDPLAGHTNPFRPGTDRTATDRSYRVAWDLAIGDPVELNPAGAHGQPYSSKEQRRTAALITAQGPWGADGSLGNGIANGRGELNLGSVWVRYYAIDHGVDAFGGVPLPKVWFELPTGERYLIVSDYSGFAERVDKTVPATETEPAHPAETYGGPSTGWGKSFSIFHNIVGGIYQNGVSGITKEYGRELELGLAGRGEGQPGAGSFEAHATICVHNTYLGRTSVIGPEDPWRPGTGGKVLVLTGRMPTFPDTRGGAATMPTAELRYWSLVGYEIDFTQQLIDGTPMPATHVVMDDEVVLDAERRYVIVYSRAADRPANATAENGVTWVDWGPNHELSILFRWMSVAPDWTTFPNPHDYESQLTWENASWSGTDYAPRLLANNHQGHLGDRLPQAHYMSRADFEALDSDGLATDMPAWRVLVGNGHLRPARQPLATQGGLQVSTAAAADGTDLDAFDSLDFVSAGSQSGIDTSKRPSEDDYAIRFDGYLEVSHDDMFRFVIDSAAAIRLRIDGATVLRDDGQGSSRTLTVDCGLALGRHRFTMDVLAAGGDDALAFRLAHRWQTEPQTPAFWSWSHSTGGRSIVVRPTIDAAVLHDASGVSRDQTSGFRFDGMTATDDHVFSFQLQGDS